MLHSEGEGSVAIGLCDCNPHPTDEYRAEGPIQSRSICHWSTVVAPLRFHRAGAAGGTSMASSSEPQEGEGGGKSSSG